MPTYVYECAEEHDNNEMSYTSAQEKLVNQWVAAALRHAVSEPLEEDGKQFASVAGVQGAWGLGDNDEEAKEDLRTCLADWATLHLEGGNADLIPVIDGIDLDRSRWLAS